MAMIERLDPPRRAGRRHWLVGAALCALLWPAPLVQAGEPALPPELKLPAKPTAMPAFALPTTAGSKLDSQSLQGQVLVIRFWASW
ncbi:MAG: hypothetical protein GEV05_12820 [Betaproteobacteria bacterium]|nr:hypothetical protein [Betaproteobacteria bacterium]